MTTTKTLRWTGQRIRVFRLVTGCGATEESPTYFAGPDFRTAIWLYENEQIGKVGRAFCPLTPVAGRKVGP